MEIIILDGLKMIGRENAHSYLKKVMRLPEYYGKNLDALSDVLGEFGRDVTIILQHASFLRNEPTGYGGRIVEVFRAAAEPGNAFAFIEKD